MRSERGAWPRRVIARLIRLAGEETGALLMETTVSIAVFGIIATAVLSGVQTTNIATDKFDRQAVGGNIVRNQLESIFSEPYQPPGNSYTAYIPPPPYTVETQNLVWDTTTTDVAKIIVTVFYHADLVQTIETIRANR